MFNPKERLQYIIEFDKREDFEEHLSQYHTFLDVLVYLNQALKDENVKVENWQAYFEGLVLKFYFNGFTIYNILKGFKMETVYFSKQLGETRIIDYPSLKILLRSQLECILMFNHLFINAESTDEKRLRVCSWILHSLIGRENFSAETESARQQKERDKIRIRELRDEVQTLNSFNSLSKNQQEALLKSGSGRLFKKWNAIFHESGWDKDHIFSKLYYHCSTYAHSEAISIIQFQQKSLNYESVKKDCLMEMNASKLLTCFLILRLVEIFPSVENRFLSLPDELILDAMVYGAQAL
jgi:hypothetical protein